MIITGLRSVGKTVLLSAFDEAADARRWVTIDAEITKKHDFATLQPKSSLILPVVSRPANIRVPAQPRPPSVRSRAGVSSTDTGSGPVGCKASGSGIDIATVSPHEHQTLSSTSRSMRWTSWRLSR